MSKMYKSWSLYKPDQKVVVILKEDVINFLETYATVRYENFPDREVQSFFIGQMAFKQIEKENE